ncbi:MAG TPA: transposase [Actinomycetota bacterium]|nr:transposase [Actinomycetota bacterium]
MERIYQRTKAADKELKQLLHATGTSLMDLHGIGPSGAARLLVEVGDITRFPTRAHFASWNGTAPIDASSGDQIRHRLSRAGNRQINRVLHIMAIVQLRNPTEGRAYFDRKTAAGKTSMEAMRSLKRRLSDIVYRHMVHDALTQAMTGPGGHRGATTDSSAAGSHPHTGTSDKPLPGPASPQPTTALGTAGNRAGAPRAGGAGPGPARVYACPGP